MAPASDAVASAPRHRVARPGRLERAQAAAVELAREGGYDAVTMVRVAERSGISRASLYHHYSSKDHLLVAAFADMMDVQVSSPTPETLARPTAVERVLGLFDQAIEGALVDHLFVDAYVRAFQRAPYDLVTAVPNVFADHIDTAIGSAIRPPRRGELARVLEYVFSTVLLSVVGRGLSADELRGEPVDHARSELRMAVGHLLGRR